MTSYSYLADSVEAARLHAVQTMHDYLHSLDRYSQKGDFEVKKLDLNKWLILTDLPTFYPNCSIQAYLDQFYFHSSYIDDECCLVVSLKSPVNDAEDEDFIKEAIDYALEILPKYRELERAECRVKAAENNYRKLSQRVESLRASIAA